MTENKTAGRNAAFANAAFDNAGGEFEFVDDAALRKKNPAAAFDVTDDDNPESSVIMHSIEYLDAAQIELSKPKKPKTAAEIASDVVRNIVFAVSVCVFVVCLFLLAENLIDKYRGAEYYAELAEGFDAGEFMLAISGDGEGDNASGDTADAADTGTSGSSSADGSFRAASYAVAAAAKSKQSVPSTGYADALERSGASQDTGGGASQSETYVSGTYNAALEKMKAQLNQYRLVNPDTYGWIYVEGTHINYALVQSEDNEFYLDHDYEGNPLKIGAIFVDFRNNRTILKNFNTVMYGHNIASGLMFHDVTLFLDPEFFAKTKIYIYTFDGAYVYEPFAVYQSRADYQYFRTSFASTGEFVDFAYEMKSNSEVPSDMEFTDTDRMITMSTCTNTLNTLRYALQAKLVQIIK